MRYLALLCCAAVAAGCSKPDQTPAPDTTAVVTPPPPAPISLADVAGTWNMTVKAEGSDSVLVNSQLVATADTSGWTTVLPGRPPLKTRVVEVAGDSITTETGPYESVLRKGVQVTTRGVMRLVGGRLVGVTVARYAGVTTADSVVRLRSEGTRAP